MSNIYLSGFSLNELLEKIGQVIDSKLSQVAAQNSNENQSRLLTRKEVSKFLQISLPTLNDYTKQGWLIQYKIGNRVLYKQAEIEQAVDRLATYKHKKGVGMNS